MCLRNARRSRSISPKPQSAAMVSHRNGHRALFGLITVEVALALAVLVGAGLFLRSFQQLQAMETGVETDRVVTASLSLPGARYREAPLVHAFFDELLETVGSMPGVDRASITAYLPFGGEGAARTLYFAILLPHTVMAALLGPMVFITMRRAIRGEQERHRQIARFTWPIWMYVSITGVLIYFMLYQWFPAAA